MKKIVCLVAGICSLLATSAFAQESTTDAFGCVAQIDKRVVTDVMGFSSSLNMNSCNLQDADMQSISAYLNTHPNIAALSLKDNNLITTKGYSQLTNNKNLKELAVDAPKNQADPVVQGIAKISSLETLSMQDISVSPEEALALASMPNLKTVQANNAGLGNMGAKALATTRSIQFLFVVNNNIGREGAVALAKIPSLIVLDISNNYIGDQGIAALAQAPGLKLIAANANHIGDKGAQALSKKSSSRPSELAFFLQHNDITNIGAYYLADNDALGGILYLGISYNLLTATGLKALQEARSQFHIYGMDAMGYDDLLSAKKRVNVNNKALQKMTEYCQLNRSIFCKNMLSNLLHA